MDTQNIVEDNSYTRTPTFINNPKPIRKLSFKLVLIFSPILIIVIFSYIFLINPYQVSGSAIKPFAYRDIVLTEKITYLFKKPQVSDRVIFKPEDYQNDLIGIITKIDNNNTYTIQSSNGSPWIITQDKIKNKIYYPFISNTEILKIVSDQKSNPSPAPAVSPTAIPSVVSPKLTPTNEPSSLILISPTLSAKIPSPTRTSIPTPTRTPNPPILTISYPSQNQAITFTSQSQKLCIVDIPAGGDTSGLQKKHNINNQGWTSYVDNYSLCFEPMEGSNTLTIQYKNKYGEESVMYTRQFTFHRQQDITVTLNGQVFNDLNCNNIKDSGETGYSESITIMQPNGFVFETLTSGSDGNYSFSKTIAENEALTIQPSPNDHNLIFTPPTVTLNSSNRSATVNISHCP